VLRQLPDQVLSFSRHTNPSLPVILSRRHDGLGGANLLRHNDPNRPHAVAKPAALAFHELSGASAFHAVGYDLEFGAIGIGDFSGNFFDDLGLVIFSQPGCQFPQGPFPLRDRKLLRLQGPPIRHASVTDRLSTIEKDAGFGATKETMAVSAAFDSQQSQSFNQVAYVMFQV
jgi:hypothetical protein